LAASLLALSAAATVFTVGAPPAGAVDNNYVDVILTRTGFIPATVYARPGDLVRFSLDTSDPNMTRDHTVTLEAGRCASLPNQLCEKSFDDPDNPPVFRFSTADSYPYFDHFHQDWRGTIVITAQPPVTTTTAPPTTPTTAAHPAQSTTTTTAAGAVHPFVVNDPPPVATTTTTTPAHLSVVTIPSAAPAKPADTAAAAAGDNGKGKGKAAAAGSTTTTTAPPAPPDASIFNEASLIPTPQLAAAAPSNPPVEDVTSPAADLLHPDHHDGDTRLLVVAVAALAAFLLGVAVIGWCRRSSRYFPA
jgi:plastocyanin